MRSLRGRRLFEPLIVATPLCLLQRPLDLTLSETVSRSDRRALRRCAPRRPGVHGRKTPCEKKSDFGHWDYFSKIETRRENSLVSVEGIRCSKTCTRLL